MGLFGGQKFGAFTTLNSTDQLSNFPTTYNANINKTIEIGTTSVASITELSNLATVGTITSGTWTGTAISATKGGTGQTTWSTGQILYASGADTLTKLTPGTNGQLLTLSGGIPAWSSPSVDLAIDYSWTGAHTFASTTATTTFRTPTNIFTAPAGKIGIGTSSPFMSLSVATNTYIGGGLGVGVSTTTAGNVQISGFVGIGGTTTTNGLAILETNICVGCVGATIVSGTQALDTTQGNATSKEITCNGNDVVVGGGFSGLPIDITSSQVSYADYENYPSATNKWKTSVVALRASNTAGTLTVYAICVNP